EGGGLAVEGDRDAVGDLDGAAAEVLDLDLAGVGADGDARGEVLQDQLGHVLPGREHPRAGDRGVEGRHDRAAGGEDGQAGQAGGERLVDVEDVEVALDAPAPHAGRRARPEGEAGDGAVVGDGDGLASGDDVVGQVGGRGGRSEDGDLVAGVDEGLGEVADVELDAARHVEGVRAHDPDPQSPHQGLAVS